MMKNLVAVLSVAIAATLPSSARADDCANANTQLAMNQCASEAYATSDKELNTVYAQIKRRLNGNAPASRKLVVAQKAWIVFRDSECDFSASGVEGGSIYSMIVIDCQTALTNKRIDDLKTYLNCQEGDLSCPVPRS